jgi:hypothetical protein
VVAGAVFAAGFAALTLAARARTANRTRTEHGTGAAGLGSIESGENGNADGGVGQRPGDVRRGGAGGRARSRIFTRARAATGLPAAMRERP